MILLEPGSSCTLSTDVGSRHRGEVPWEYVALRAYRFWEEAGKPEGERPDGKSWADYFWLRAETALE